MRARRSIPCAVIVHFMAASFGLYIPAADLGQRFIALPARVQFSPQNDDAIEIGIGMSKMTAALNTLQEAHALAGGMLIAYEKASTRQSFVEAGVAARNRPNFPSFNSLETKEKQTKEKLMDIYTSSIRTGASA